MMFMSFNSNTIDATSRARPAYPSRAPEFTPGYPSRAPEFTPVFFVRFVKLNLKFS